MKSIQIGSAASVPVKPGPIGFFWSWPTQTPRDVGIEAQEPRIRVVVGRPGLASYRPVERLGAGGGAAQDDTAQKVGHDERRVCADRVVRLRPVFFQNVSVAIRDPQHVERVMRTPWFGNTANAVVISCSVASAAPRATGR